MLSFVTTPSQDESDSDAEQGNEAKQNQPAKVTIYPCEFSGLRKSYAFSGLHPSLFRQAVLKHSHRISKLLLECCFRQLYCYTLLPLYSVPLLSFPQTLFSSSSIAFSALS